MHRGGGYEMDDGLVVLHSSLSCLSPRADDLLNGTWMVGWSSANGEGGRTDRVGSDGFIHRLRVAIAIQDLMQCLCGCMGSAMGGVIASFVQ